MFVVKVLNAEVKLLYDSREALMDDFVSCGFKRERAVRVKAVLKLGFSKFRS